LLPSISKVRAKRTPLPKLIDAWRLYAAVKKARNLFDFDDVLAELAEAGYPMQAAWFAPHLEFRFPLYGHADALGIRHRAMASGGGHDAAAFVQAGIPAGMIFVRNQNGSHNPHEAMRMDDFAAACAVVTRWAAEMAQ
jgi:di/tripeptidase